MSRAFVALFLREMQIARRVGGSASMGVAFFLCLVAITPFAVGPDPKLLARIGPAILWISALLAALLGLDRLFQADAEEGSLDQFHLAGLPLELAVVAKCAAHWVSAELPLVVAAPLLGLMLDQEAKALAAVTASLLLGSPALTLIGAMGAAATVSVRRGGLLMALLVLPLAIPVLIFGVSAASAATAADASLLAPFAFLGALALAALALCPFAAAALLRQL